MHTYPTIDFQQLVMQNIYTLQRLKPQALLHNCSQRLIELSLDCCE